LETTQILESLSADGPLPVEALRAAGEQRDALAPLLIQAIESCIARGAGATSEDLLFFAFHLLGAWREKGAYRSLARFLRLPAAQIDEVLGDATTSSTHRVLAAVFDGDPLPLYDVIHDPGADEFVRSRICETLAMLAHRGQMPREEARRFLHDSFDHLRPRRGNFVWNGWQSAIAMLGLVELKPLVERAFREKRVDPTWLGFKDFEDDLDKVLRQPDAPPWASDEGYSPFGDPIEEFSHWHGFSKEAYENRASREEEPDEEDSLLDPTRPLINPFRHVGRNDPCPCGSGLKFKRCCGK